jgi:hypothetical protein
LKTLSLFRFTRLGFGIIIIDARNRMLWSPGGYLNPRRCLLRRLMLAWYLNAIVVVIKVE